MHSSDSIRGIGLERAN